MIQDKKRMRKAQKKSTKKHLERLQEKQCDPELTRAYSGILLNLDRVADNWDCSKSITAIRNVHTKPGTTISTIRETLPGKMRTAISGL